MNPVHCVLIHGEFVQTFPLMLQDFTQIQCSGIIIFFKSRKTSISYPFIFSLIQPNESIRRIIKSKGDLDIQQYSAGYIQLQTEYKPSQKIMQRSCKKGKSIGRNERSKFTGFWFFVTFHFPVRPHQDRDCTNHPFQLQSSHLWNNLFLALFGHILTIPSTFLLSLSPPLRYL